MFEHGRRSSFDAIDAWDARVNKACDSLGLGTLPKALVVNKTDRSLRKGQAQIGPEEGQYKASAMGQCRFYEASAKTGENIDEVFYALARACIRSDVSGEVDGGTQSIRSTTPTGGSGISVPCAVVARDGGAKAAGDGITLPCTVVPGGEVSSNAVGQNGRAGAAADDASSVRPLTDEERRANGGGLPQGRSGGVAGAEPKVRRTGGKKGWGCPPSWVRSTSDGDRRAKGGVHSKSPPTPDRGPPQRSGGGVARAEPKVRRTGGKKGQGCQLS